MATDEKPDTFYVRAGAAHEGGAPLGASLNVATSARTEGEARAVGGMFSEGDSFRQPGTVVDATNAVTRAPAPTVEKDPSFWDRVGGVVSGVGRPILRALEWGTELTGNLSEASLRTNRDRAERMSQGEYRVSDTFTPFTASPLWGWTQADWRQNWDKAVDANASVGQTAWLIAEEGFNDAFGWAGTSGSGIEDPLTGEFMSGGITSRGLSLLDDPERYVERQEYFSEGAAHWTTGIGDAFWQIFADPLLAAGKAGSLVKGAKSALTAEDVAVVTDRAIDAGDLSGKQARARNVARELAESFEQADSASGAIAGAARSKYLKNTTDGGAIAYLMQRAGEGIDDAALRIEARMDVIFAGMGDARALGRLSERSGTLEVELRRLQAGASDLTDDIDDILLKTGDDAALVAEAHAKQAANPLTAREMEVRTPEIRRELDAIERVTDLGRPVRGEGALTDQLGQLARNVPLTNRGVASVIKTVNSSALLKPVHYLGGMHLPGTFRLSADDAHEVFHAANQRAHSVLGKGHPLYSQYRERLLALEDEFMAAGTGASSKAPRQAVMDQFNRTVDEMVAAKHQLWQKDPKTGATIRDEAGNAIPDVDAVHALFNTLRARRMADIQNVATRVYKAKEAGAAPAAALEDGIYAVAGKAQWIEDLGTPVARSQIQDYVSIVDPRQLDKFAARHLATGLKGKVMRSKDTGAYEVGHELLAMGNRLWKFGALLRPGAYLIRSQIDQQARVLATVGPLKYMALASAGTGNAMRNLRRVDKAEAAAFTERAYKHQRLDQIERELVHRGLDPERLAPTPMARAKSLEARASEVKARRAQIKGLRRDADPDAAAKKIEAIDAKIAALSPRAVKTREKLMAQRDRLAAQADAWTNATRLDDEARELTSQIDELRNAEPDTIARLTDELTALREEVAKPVDWRATGEKVRLRRTALAEHIGQSAKLDRKTGAWTSAKITDAYWNSDEFIRVQQQIDATDSILGLVTGMTRAELDGLRGTGNWDQIAGDAPNWVDSYLRAVNHQVRSDQLGQRILAGDSDEAIMAWFRNDDQGRAYLRDMMGAGGKSPEVVVQRLREHIDALVPQGSGVRNNALIRNLTKDDVKAEWKVPSERPRVPGEILQPNFKNVIMRQYEQIERSYFNWFAAVPDHMMGRHPFYAARFQEYAQDALNRAGVNDGARLSVSQVNDIRRQAATMARKDVSKYLFDTSRQSNLHHMLRFVSPFYGAWSDTMRKWGRIMGDNPAAIPAFWDAMRAPNAGGWVVDQDGNPIDVYGNVRDDEGNIVKTLGVWDGHIIVPIPDHGIGKWVQERTGADELRFAKNGANIIFQGEPPILPGPGPILAIPANEVIVRAFPEAWGEEGEENPILRYLLPYGPTSDSVQEQALPSWTRAVGDAISQDGRRMDAVFAQLYAEQVNLERNGEVDPLTNEQRLDLVANRVRNWAVLRIFGTQSPVSFSPDSRLAHYKSEFDRYRREYGGEAEDRFAEDYPDYFDMAISLSANETGLTATDESWGAVQSYRKDIAKNPEYGWFWAGAANWADGWSQGVYHAQMRQEIGPGSNLTFRSRKDPLEAARQTQVSAGWREYQQVMTDIRLRMEELGLTSLQQNDAAQLADIRRAFVADLSRRNPDWASAYGEGGNPRGRVTEFLSLAADQMHAHPELQKRGDGVAFGRYMSLRQDMQLALAERAANGGSRSINAGGNEDLKAIWSEFTTQLVASDIGFEQMWDRVLGENADGDFRDDLTGDIYGGGE